MEAGIIEDIYTSFLKDSEETYFQGHLYSKKIYCMNTTQQFQVDGQSSN